MVTGGILWVTFAFVGFYWGSRYAKASKELSATLNCIRIFSAGLRFEKASTEALLLRAAKEYSGVFPSLNGLAKAAGPLPDRIEQFLLKTSVSKDAASLWREVGKILGQSDVTTQLSRLSSLEHTGKALLEEAKENEKTQGKLFRRAGLLVGALAFILTL